MNRLKLLLAVLAAAVFAVGCVSGSGAVDRALEDIGPALQSIDRRYALYQSALDAVGGYLESPSEDGLKSAKGGCMEALAGLADLPEPESGLSAREESALVKSGLNLADYRVPFEMETYNRASAAVDLGMLLCLLEEEPVEVEPLRQYWSLLQKVNAVFRQVDFLCINELFCRFEGGRIDAFKEEFLPSLKALSADGLQWDTDSAALEARANALMDGAEADVSAYAAFVGERYAELLALQTKLADMLADAGYDDPERPQTLLAEGLDGNFE